MTDPVLVAMIAAGGALLGGGMWTFLGSWFGFREKEIVRLREDVAGLTEKHQNCEKEVAELKLRQAALEHHHASHLARWIKDAHKRVVWINSKALLSIFAPIGLGRDEVEGRPFADLIDPHAAADIERLDHAALAQPGSPASTLVKLHPDLPVMHIVKVAAAGREGQLIYEGYAYRTNDPEIALGAGLARQAEQRVVSIDHLTGGAGN